VRLFRAFAFAVVAFSLATMASVFVLMNGPAPADPDEPSTLAPDENECGEGNFTMEPASHGCDDQRTAVPPGRVSGRHTRV